MIKMFYYQFLFAIPLCNFFQISVFKQLKKGIILFSKNLIPYISINVVKKHLFYRKAIIMGYKMTFYHILDSNSISFQTCIILPKQCCICFFSSCSLAVYIVVVDGKSKMAIERFVSQKIIPLYKRHCIGFDLRCDALC